MNSRRIHQLIFLLSLIPSPLMARVHLQLGSFEWSTSLLNIQLQYSSRSLYPGWWGLGWCSALEIEVDVNRSKPLVKKCGQGVPEISVQLTKEGNYQFYAQEGSYTFNGYGKPIHIELQGRSSILLDWDRQQLKSFTQSGKIWKLNWDEGRHVRSLQSGFQTQNFTYDKGQLAEIGSQKFKYDDNSNMILIQFNAQNIRVRYDTDQDRVTSVQIERGCTTLYKYDESLMEKKLVLKTNVTRLCSERPPQSKSVESTFEIKADSVAKLKGVQEVYL